MFDFLGVVEGGAGVGVGFGMRSLIFFKGKYTWIGRIGVFLGRGRLFLRFELCLGIFVGGRGGFVGRRSEFVGLFGGFLECLDLKGLGLRDRRSLKWERLYDSLIRKMS